MTHPNGSNGHSRNGRHSGFVDPILLNNLNQRLVQNSPLNAMGDPSSMSRSWMSQLEDPRRDIDAECGYPPDGMPVSVDLYRQLYDRHEIAARVVECEPKESWEVQPLVYEDEDASKVTDFEEDWDALGQNLQPETSWYQDEAGSVIWEYLLRLDIAAGIGQFGVLLLGIDDGRNLQEPVDGMVLINTRIEKLRTEARTRRWRDEEGRTHTVNRSRYPTGPARVVVTNRAAPMPDSPPTQAELDYMRAGCPRQKTTWNKEQKCWENTEVKAPLSSQEQLTVNQLEIHRQKCLEFLRSTALPDDGNDGRSNFPANPLRNRIVANISSQREYVRNQRSSEAAQHPSENADRRKKPAPQPAGGGVAQFGSIHRQSTDRQGIQGEAPPPGAFVTGTEAQYTAAQVPYHRDGQPEDVAVDPYWQSGLGLPPASLSGTDQQYFGVQFGPSEKMPPKPTKRHKLLFLRPFDESLVQIVRYEWNIFNPRFGLPTMYRITLNDPRNMHSGVGLPMATVYVHWSRVVHYADSRLVSDIFGFERMRQVLNRLLDLKKIYGASGEGFWRGAFLKIFFSTHPQLGGDVIVDDSQLQDMMEQMMNSGQQWGRLSGMNPVPIAPQVVDPTPHINAHIEAVCIKLGIPVRVFKGSERGELASSQDDASWNDRRRHRQYFRLTPTLICPFINRLISLGILSEPEGYSVEWPDLDATTDNDKATVLGKRTGAMAQAVQSGMLTSLIQPKDYLVREMHYSEEEAEEILKATAEVADKQQSQHEDLADEHGFVPQPPAGYQNAPPESSYQDGQEEDSQEETGGDAGDEEEPAESEDGA